MTVDKDGSFLDTVEDTLHHAWIQGDVTNEFRNQFANSITEMRDWL